MIQKVQMDGFPTLALVRGNIALYPIASDDFSYFLRHIPTQKIMAESATREAALEAFRQLSALHSWDLSYVEIHKLPCQLRNLAHQQGK